MLMEWHTRKFFSVFEKKPEYSKNHNIYNFYLECTNDFDEINYSFTFRPLSSKEFGNVYNEKCMNAF